MSTTTSFRVYGTEFCQVLQAVGMFQADPRKFPMYAAVRCFATVDGLTMLALNGASSAAGLVPLDDLEGAGLFSIPSAQVKVLLAVFSKPLPKHTTLEEYVLEVTVTDRWVKVHDVSTLFEGDEYVMALPDPEAVEAHEESDTARIMRTAVSALNTLAAGAPIDLADGVYFSPVEVSRMARAAKALGHDLHLRGEGRMLLAPISDTFVAATVAMQHADTDERPLRDERALAEFRSRLDSIVEQGAL